MRVCLGGTFDPFHDGHESLLRRAFEDGGEVLIGLTSDSMVSAKGRRVRAFTERKRHLEQFLRSRGWENFTIEEIDDRFGPAAHLAELDAIVVSEETERTASDLNEVRSSGGLKPLQILRVPLLPADDGLAISSTRISQGDIDASGRVMRVMRVFVGTGNQVKVRAVQGVLERIYDNLDVRRREVETGVPPQPRGDEALRGAVARAREAIGRGHLGIGIEAGLIWHEETRRHLDIQYCAVVDRSGRVTVGCGPGFEHPPAVVRMVEGGGTVGEAMEALTGIQDIGKGEGAIGYLTEGRMDRQELTEIAVLMAMVPRVRRKLYL
ncbi:MAG: inosine/xanthosine triphosphatase [Candidatus Thermoplasmatota archaeon]|nr:inosine/xanthosine triphosphatase [Candidatus Thermoplasmatota archaeon]